MIYLKNFASASDANSDCLTTPVIALVKGENNKTIIASKEVGDIVMLEGEGESLIANAISGVSNLEELVAALASAEENAVIVLSGDIDGQFEYTNTANITLDLNGHKIESDLDWTIKNNGGLLTIKDSKHGEGIVKNTKNSMDAGIAVWARTGSIVIEDGTFINSSNYEATVYVGTKVTDATIVINGGTFINEAEGEYNWHAGWAPINVNIYNALSIDRFTVNGGTYSADPRLGDDNLGEGILAEGKDVRVLSNGMFRVI